MTNHNGESKPLLKSISLRNFLSFGPESPSLELNRLNVLIGPNGSGKSNLIEALSLLKRTPAGLRDAILQGGGVQEWICKGSHTKVATIDVVVENAIGSQPLRHVLAFREENQAFRIEDERIENMEPYADKPDAYFYYRYQRGYPYINVAGEQRKLKHEDVENDSSILAQRKDPDSYPEITYLGHMYSQIAIYREWAFGRNSVFREPQKADMPNDRLREDFANLGLYLNRLRQIPKAKRSILDGLRDLYAGFDDFDVKMVGSTVQVNFTEGDFTIPATRLSDGTLRYLCLLAILCDPAPPPLICIEEPELGLHPDIIPKLVDHMMAASQRTQLVITTHSDILVDSLTDHPESVVVCEKMNGQSTMTRLGGSQLSEWLRHYRLGELWTKGELGGTRW